MQHNGMLRTFTGKLRENLFSKGIKARNGMRNAVSGGPGVVVGI